MRGAIWLVGMMGAGKSTVGPRLAVRLGRPFVDTDEVVRARTGRDISDIFERDGEAAFRSLEADAVEGARTAGAVVALGGGAAAQPGAAERLAACGTLVYLRARPETLLGRIDDSTSRPLLAGLAPPERLERIASLLAEREPAYATAPVIVDVEGLDEDRIAERIAADLALLECR